MRPVEVGAGRLDIPGYLEGGVPPHYGNGASHVVQSIHKDPLSKHRFVTDFLGDGDIDRVRLVIGEKGADPNIAILLPEGRVPWSGHSGRYAAPQVMAEIETHKTTLVFCNTRSLAELIFQDLWKVNTDSLPIGVHHGSLALEARRKVEGAMASGRLRALVATASLDLGVDWGNVDCVIQMGAPKGSSRLLQRIGRANHRLDEPSEAIVVPGNRFEYLEARAALDAIDEGELDADIFRAGALDVLAQHIMACACAALLGPIWAGGPVMVTINLMLLGVALALTPLILRQTKRLSAPVPLRRRMAPA